MLELLTTDEEDFAELEETTELELTTELLDCFVPEELAMTLLDELPGSSVVAEDDESDGADDEVIKAEDDEAVKIEEDDTSAGISSPGELFAEVLSSQAARPKASANAQVPKARKFFFTSNLNPAISKIFYRQIYKNAVFHEYT